MQVVGVNQMQKLKQDKVFGIGDNLRRQRKRKGYTQVDIAAKLDLYGLNISRVTYNKMEHNNYSIRINELLALKLILDCDFEDFFQDIEYPKMRE